MNFSIFKIEIPLSFSFHRSLAQGRLQKKSDNYHFWGEEGGQRGSFITFFFGLKMIFKQFQTIKIFHVQYPPPPRGSLRPPWRSHECLVRPKHRAVRPTRRMVCPTCHKVRPTRCKVRPTRRKVWYAVRFTSFLANFEKFSKCFQLFQGQKYIFFKKCSKNGLVSKKNRKYFYHFLGGGVRPQSDKNHFFFEAFP